MKALVVDDDFAAAASLRIALHQDGIETRTANGGTEALLLLGAESFDWLVTDGQMRPMDGFRLAEKARLIQPRIRIVMISGVFTPEAEKIDRFEKVFTKPVDAGALADYLLHSPRPA